MQVLNKTTKTEYTVTLSQEEYDLLTTKNTAVPALPAGCVQFTPQQLLLLEMILGFQSAGDIINTINNSGHEPLVDPDLLALSDVCGENGIQLECDELYTMYRLVAAAK